MGMITRRRVLAGTGAAWVAGTAAARAEGWPQRPVTLVVPQAAGNSPDVLCRMLAERLSRSLGQQFVVENRPGAANVVGTQAVVRAAPDGYTLLFATSASLVTNPYTFKRLAYDPLKDLTPVSMVARSNHVLAVSPSVPARTFAELVAVEKAAPGTMTIAVDGPRNLSGLIAQSINKYAGTRFVLVPYNTISAAIQDTLTGRTQVTVQSTSVAEPHILEGTLRPLAVAGTKRIATMPDVPPLADSVPALDLQGWFMVLGPAGLPAEIKDRLSTEFLTMLGDKAIQANASRLGFEIDPTGPIRPADAAAFLQKEHAASGRIIKDLGIEPE